jgi:hypothetical protein
MGSLVVCALRGTDGRVPVAPVAPGAQAAWAQPSLARLVLLRLAEPEVAERQR